MSKLKIVLIVILILAIILLGVFWYLSRQKEAEIILPDVTTEDENFIEPEQEPEVQAPVTAPQISEQEKLQAQLQKLASSFAERYGSYSNQSDFENLEDLLPFMSASLKSTTENFIRDKRTQAGYAEIYYGITTKSLNTQVINFTPEIGRAKFKISCQRQELVGSSANANVYYQDINIELIKEAGVWKVDKVEWL